MQTRLMNLLNIRSGEGRNVALLLAYYFFIGAAMVLVQSASYALLFQSWDATVMPYVYLGTAVIVFSVTALFLRFSERTSLARLLVLCLVFLLSGTLLFRIGLGVSSSKWLLLALPIWSDAFINLSVMAFWTLVGNTFDIRQGKRIFGLMNAGSWLAFGIMGPLVAPLVNLLGTENLYLMAAVFTLIAIQFLSAILRANPRISVSPQPAGESRSKPVSVRRLLYKKYILQIFLLVALWNMAYIVLDNIFYDRSAIQFSDAGALAGFLGVFFGVVGMLGFITDVFVTGRIISRFGLRAGILITPTLAVCIVVALAVTGTLDSSQLSILFWLAVAGKLTSEALGSSLDQSGIAVLYQPIEENERVRVRAITEGMVQPLAIGLTGGFLFLLNTVEKMDAIRLAYIYLGVALAWIAVSILMIRAYPTALRDALYKRRFGEAGLTVVDIASFELLKGALDSPHPNEVIYALDLLEKSRHVSFPDLTMGLIGSPHFQVRANAIQRVERLHIIKALPLIEHQLQNENEPLVREVAACALTSLSETHADLLKSTDPSIRRGALTGLLRRPESGSFPAAKERLAVLAGSRSAQDRIEAANLIAESFNTTLSGVLLPLITDPDSGVRLAAIRAAGKIMHTSLWPAVIPALGFPGTRSAAFSALVAGGEQALPEIMRGITNDALDHQIRIRLVRACSHIKGEAASNELKKLIAYPNTSLRSRVLVALHACRFVCDDEFVPHIEAQIQYETRRVKWLLTCLSIPEYSGSTKMLIRALQYDLSETRNRLFYLFGFMYDSVSVHRARKAFLQNDTNRRAYAIEVMDSILSRPHKAGFIPLLEDSSEGTIPEDSRFHSSQELSPKGEHIMNILSNRLALESPWVMAIALEVALRFNLPGCEQIVADLKYSNEPKLIRLLEQVQKESSMLSTIERVIILKSISLFESTPDEALAELADLLEEIDFEAGETVVEKGAKGDSLYVIVRGRVAVLDNERVLNELGEREVFGELSLLDSAVRTATVRALEETTVLRLAQAPYYDLMTDYVEVAMGTIQMLTRNLRARTSDVAELNRMLKGEQTNTFALPHRKQS